MRREGRQHGVVRTRAVLPRQGARVVHLLTSPPTAGVFTRATSKPTNHSKFTGRCDRQACPDCHTAPTSKSRCKAKGERKAAAGGDAASALGFDVGRYGKESATEVANGLIGTWKEDHDDQVEMSFWYSDDGDTVWSSSDDDGCDHPVEQQQLLRGESAYQLAHVTHDGFAEQLDSVARDSGGAGLAAATTAAADVEDWFLVEP